MSGYYYKEHPQTCDPEDFWGQVKRTVNGNPVSQDQIDMIVAAVCDGLNLGRDDFVLDVCCGNGALTTYFFQRCAGGLGVDYSEFLIEVARKNFIKKPDEEFQIEDVVSFARTYSQPERFTKAVCYGSLQYLPKADAAELLKLLRSRFTGLKTIFVGNLPDKQRVEDFLGQRLTMAQLDLPDTAIGIWRTHDEFEQLATDAGWHVQFRQMPPAYFGAHYRFDAVLVPKSSHD